MNDKKGLKGLGEEHKTPEALEQEVFKTLGTVKLLADIVDLFTVKYIKAEGEMFGIGMDENEENNEK